MDIVTIVTVLIILGAIVTLVPYPPSRKRCAFGYRALCPFAPYSSVTLLLVAGVIWLIGTLA